MTRRRMRSSTSTYLTALAISDLLYLVFVFTLSLEHYPNSRTIDFYYYWVYYRFGLWLTDATGAYGKICLKNRSRMRKKNLALAADQ